MRRIALIFCASFFLLSCKEEVPDGIVSTDKMENIMWDIIRADEMINHQYAYDSTINKKQKATQLYSQIFSVHQITHKGFQKNFQYYQTRPDLLKTIFDSLSVKNPETRTPLNLELIKSY